MIAEFRPRRPNAARLKCDGCNRVFAAGSVPSPNAAGELICRDCRAERGDRGAPDRPLF